MIAAPGDAQPPRRIPYTGNLGPGRPASTPRKTPEAVEKIGRGTRDVQAEQLARGGMSDAAEAQAQDDFARRLMSQEPPQRRNFNDPQVRYVPTSALRDPEKTHQRSIRSRNESGGSVADAQGNIRTRETLDALRERLRSQGFTEPLNAEVIGGKADMLEGTHRSMLAEEAGIPEVPVKFGGNQAAASEWLASILGNANAYMGLIGMAAQQVPGFRSRFARTNWMLNGGPLGDLYENMAENMPNNPYNAPGYYGNPTVSA